MRRWVLVLGVVGVVGALLGGCASSPEGSPAPVESRSYPPAVSTPSIAAPSNLPATPGEVQVRAYQPPQPIGDLALNRPKPSRAVQVLANRAEDQRRGGNYAAAAASLERALRIDPGNARLWSELAQVNFEQGQYARVEQLAAKSNALLGNDEVLRAENWHWIAKARDKLGDAAGAAKARERARLIR